MKKSKMLLITFLFSISISFLFAQSPVELPAKYLGGDATLGYPEIISGSGMYGGTFCRFYAAYDRSGHVLILYVDDYNRDINVLCSYNEDMSKKHEYDIYDILNQSTGKGNTQILKLNYLSQKIFLVLGTGFTENQLVEFSIDGKIQKEFQVNKVYNPILDMDRPLEPNTSINLSFNNNLIFNYLRKNKKIYYDVIDLNQNIKQVKNDFLEYLDPNQVYTGIKSIDDNIYNYLKSEKIFWIPGSNDDWIGQANILYYYVYGLVKYYKQDVNKYESFANAFPFDEMRQKNSVFFDAKKNIYIFKHGTSSFYFGIFDSKGKLLGEYVTDVGTQQEIIQELAVNQNGNITFFTKGKSNQPGKEKNNYHFYLIENTWDPMDINELKKQGYYLDPFTNSTSTMIHFSSLSSSGYPTEQFDKYAYHPARAFDGNPLTSWIEDKPGFGDGSSISASCNPSVNIDEIRISGGYFDAQWWAANNRIKKAIVTINGKDYAMDFADKMVPQSLKLPAEVLLTDFKLTIKDAYLAVGQTWNDTAISEIEFYYKGKKIPVDLGDYSQYLKVTPISSQPDKRINSGITVAHHVRAFLKTAG